LSGRIPLACLALLVMAPVLASASGFYVPSVGARASAMGGAFVGLADDYSAVHWNPAGIGVIQGTEATVSLHDFILLASRDGEIAFRDYEDDYSQRYVRQSVSATATTQNRIAPSFFLYSDAGPLCGLFSKVGICGYAMAEYGAKWDGDDVADAFISHPDNYNIIDRIGDAPDYMSHVAAYAISPVVSRDFSERLSVGITGHFVYTKFELSDGNWVGDGDFDEEAPPNEQYSIELYSYEREEELTGWGYGATVGVLYKASDLLTVGATARTPINVPLEGDVEVSSTWEAYSTESQSESFDLTLPMWAGVGIAYDDFLFEGTVLTADAQWTQWSEIDEIVREVETELPNDLGTTTLNWEDTVEFGVGLDYRLSRSTSVRLGYRSVPTPVDDETFSFTMPMSQKSIFSFGVGYRSDVWRLDASLEYHTGDKRRLTGTSYMDGKHLDDVMIPSLSFTYGF